MDVFQKEQFEKKGIGAKIGAQIGVDLSGVEEFSLTVGADRT